MAGALEAYEQAGDIYMNEDASACVLTPSSVLVSAPRSGATADSLPPRSANACYKEAAELAGTLGQYPRAVSLFERVAAQSLGSALTRYGVKEHYLKAGLCWLATGDVVSAKRAVDGYAAADPSFATTREAAFLNAIADAYDAGDAEEYTAHVAEYDRCVSVLRSLSLSLRVRACARAPRAPPSPSPCLLRRRSCSRAG